MTTLAELVAADHLPSGREFAALLPLLLLVGGLVVYCLVDLTRAPHAQHLPKLAWALLIVVCSPPFGAIAYLVFGKDRNDRQHGPVDRNENITVDERTRV
jgi:hypothetical protein